MDYNTIFYYDETSPSGLRYKYSSAGTKKGDVVGNLRADGYYHTQAGCKNHKTYVHRIVYEMHYGEIPKGFYVDHKDRDRSNNKIENLRIGTLKQNSYNRKVPLKKNNLPKGVSYRNGKYVGAVIKDGVRYSITTEHLGQAHAWVIAKRIELHGEWACHG